MASLKILREREWEERLAIEIVSANENLNIKEIKD